MVDGGNKLYLDNPWQHKYGRVIVGVGSEVIGFGRELDVPNAEEFIHFKKSDWDEIKAFIDERVK
jgi:hypothetical protein